MSTNLTVLQGEPTSRAAALYRELLQTHTHEELCDAYGLDRDDSIYGGTHWTAVINYAIHHGDIDPYTMELT
jgi:formylmethanofuran dehydrogenase subunit A